MSQAALIAIEIDYTNWEWGEDDLDPETVLELENFDLSISHTNLFMSKLYFDIFVVFVILGTGWILGLLILSVEIVVHKIMK